MHICSSIRNIKIHGDVLGSDIHIVIMSGMYSEKNNYTNFIIYILEFLV